MSKQKRAFFVVLDLIIMGLLVFIDRYTKILASVKLKDKEPVRLIPEVFELRYLENRGAAFGMLQDMRTLFIVVGIVFIVLVLYLLIRVPATAKYRLLRICLVMIGAGAIGNLYDRFTLNYVIDFLYFIYIDFPIFNVADIYVTVSSAILVILFIFVYKDEDLDMKKANTVKVHSSMLPREETGAGEEAEEENKDEAKKETGENDEAGARPETETRAETEAKEEAEAREEAEEEEEAEAKEEAEEEEEAEAGAKADNENKEEAEAEKKTGDPGEDKDKEETGEKDEAEDGE